jgi:hypothetical protein
VPENWGPNFGEESWGCRLAVATETVNQWQKGAEATEAIADIKLAIIEKQDFVFIERMGGSMRCFSFSALMSNDYWVAISLRQLPSLGCRKCSVSLLGFASEVEL